MRQTLKNLIEEPAQILLTAKSSFPFILFPVHLMIDTQRVTVIEKHFPFGSTTQTISVKDISSVTIEQAFPYASLKIMHKFVGNEPISISRMSPQNASKAQKIIDGLIIADREQVSLVEHKQPNISETLEEIGTIPMPQSA